MAWFPEMPAGVVCRVLEELHRQVREGELSSKDGRGA